MNAQITERAEELYALGYDWWEAERAARAEIEWEAWASTFNLGK